MFKTRKHLIFFLLFVSTAVSAEPMHQDSLIWLKKVVTASRQTNFEGTFIYQSGSYVETSRITHVLDGDNEHERLEGLDGERSEIIRRNNRVWCYLGDSKVMVAKREGARSFPALLPEQLRLLQVNYLVREGNGERVAGFHTHSIIFQPKDKMRYSHKIWADSDSGLLLKAIVMDEHNHLIEQYSFTQLKIGGEIDRKWIMHDQIYDEKNRSTSEPDQNNSNIRPLPSESGWRVYALPAGFIKITEVSRRLRGGDASVAHLVYSDGLAGISVFIEKLGDRSDAKLGLYGKGVTHVFTKVRDNNLVTVVGEVPPRTVMQVAESVRYGGHPE